MLEVKNLRKIFRDAKSEQNKTVVAIDDVTFSVQEGEFFTLLGPSGCGKTTTLRCIAGLEHADGGDITVAGRTLYSDRGGVHLRANERRLGMVFQSYAIWPHMNVFRNVSFPLEVLPMRKRPSKKEIASRVERVLSVVQLDQLARRPATDLSGGQQQRLALARALVIEPPILLLDEPLSNLDAKLREGMRFELKRLQRELKITAIYVTHDQIEALAMSNVVAVMNSGKVEQMGSPREIYDSPTSRFVAEFIGTSNFLAGLVKERETDGSYLVSTAWGANLQAKSTADVSVGAEVVISIRPEHVRIDEETSEAEGTGRWLGTVKTRMFLGESVDHVVSIRNSDVEIQARCNPSQSIAPGTEVALIFPEERCFVMPV